MSVILHDPSEVWVTFDVLWSHVETHWQWQSALAESAISTPPTERTISILANLFRRRTTVTAVRYGRRAERRLHSHDPSIARPTPLDGLRPDAIARDFRQHEAYSGLAIGTSRLTPVRRAFHEIVSPNGGLQPRSGRQRAQAKATAA